MGNTTSDVNDSLKAQADSENGPELYKLANVNGSGILATLMKNALKNKDFTELDNFIRTEVVKFLYNKGEGEHVYELNFKILLNRMNFISFLFSRFPLKKLYIKKQAIRRIKIFLVKNLCFCFIQIFLYYLNNLLKNTHREKLKQKKYALTWTKLVLLEKRSYICVYLMAPHFLPRSPNVSFITFPKWSTIFT